MQRCAECQIAVLAKEPSGLIDKWCAMYDAVRSYERSGKFLWEHAEAEAEHVRMLDAMTKMGDAIIPIVERFENRTGQDLSSRKSRITLANRITTEVVSASMTNPQPEG